MSFLTMNQLTIDVAQLRKEDQEARRMESSLRRFLHSHNEVQIAVAGEEISADNAEQRLLQLLRQEGFQLTPIQNDTMSFMASADAILLLHDVDANQFAQKNAAIPTFSTSLDAQSNGNTIFFSRKPDAVERLRNLRQEKRNRRRQTWTTALALLVAMIAVCNALLLSVFERIHEFGTMLCIGALPALIRRMVMMEALLIGFSASFSGAIAGCLISVVLAAWRYGASFNLLWSIALAKNFILVIFAIVLCALAAAVYPAAVASRMTPADALRSEV